MEAVASAGARERWARPLFILTIVTGSFLLFLTQPMVARMALPRIGGAPAVWNSAMLVYQLLLLAGYAYAHWLSQLAPRRQAGLHLILFGVAALWLPIGLASAIPPVDGEPAFWVPWFLLLSIGPLFFIISAQAPLMQRWYALESSRGDPYPLYAASNLGSFAGLLSYPLLVEPLLTLQQQSLFWTGGYALLVLLVVGCALTVPIHAVEQRPVTDTPVPPMRRILHWVALAAVPSGLMLSTTTHLTTDIVAMPLLWVLPLGLYLLSFVIAFAAWRGPAEFITQLAPLIMLIAGGLAFAAGARSPIFAATLGLSLLVMVAVALHGEMYRQRPGAGHLTAFYLALAFGGMLGGLFAAIVAPLLFDWIYEHPLLIVAAALLLPQQPLIGLLRRLWESEGAPVLALLIPATAILLSLIGDAVILTDAPGSLKAAASIMIGILALISLGRPAIFAACLAALMMSYGGWTTLRDSFEGDRTRSYFGVYTVADRHWDGTRTLTHGTTLHGLQILNPGRETEPVSYYARRSGVGIAMQAVPSLFGPDTKIGVVGLGTGTLACYAQAGQSWRFFEIDPAMVRIATDPAKFTFLSRCAPDAKIVLGDARLMLAEQPHDSFHMIAVDAFSSDAVPMHLLTREAFEVYRDTLKPEGLLLVHISNRYLDMEPVLAAAAEEGGWTAAMLSYEPNAAEQVEHANGSVWVAMSQDPLTMARLIVSTDDWRAWEELRPKDSFSGWSDDYASILPLLRRWTLRSLLP